MALIKCKECGKEISSTAGNCPYCGYRTEHGRSVSEAKVYLVWGAINSILLVVGLIMFLGNLQEFIDRFDYLDNYKYFSDEGQKAIRDFGIGVVILISCFIDSCILWDKAKQLQASGDNGSNTQSGEWVCQRCDTLNQPKANSCVRCGMGRKGVQVQIEEKIPTWKRIQMEEEKARMNAEKTDG